MAEEEIKDPEEPPKDPEVLKNLGAQTAKMVQVLTDQGTPTNEVIALVMATKNREKDALVSDFMQSHFANMALQKRVAELEGRPYEKKAEAPVAAGGNVDVPQLLSLINYIQEKEQKRAVPQAPAPQQSSMAGVMTEMLPMLMMITAMKGDSGGAGGGMNMLELIKAMKELTETSAPAPQEKQEQTVQMPIGPGGAMIDVPLSLATVLMSQQGSFSKEDLAEVLAAVQPPGQVTPQEVQRKAIEGFVRDKKFWEEFLGTGSGVSDEVAIKKQDSEIAKLKIEKEHEIKKEELKLKEEEAKAQQLLIDTILKPDPSDQKTLDRAGKATVQHLFG